MIEFTFEAEKKVSSSADDCRDKKSLSEGQQISFAMDAEGKRHNPIYNTPFVKDALEMFW